jgi:hypothetical protein
MFIKRQIENVIQRKKLLIIKKQREIQKERQRKGEKRIN